MAIDKIFNDANVDGIADNIFGAVNNSVSEVKQMQQRKAAENVQMVVEAFKKIETNITEKFDNVTDVIEKRVLTIKDGRDGSSGSDGRNGRDGKPGRDGVNGKQGTPGTPGKDGADGVDGVSVTDASIDFDGSLVISLSSGQQINVGEVVPPELERQLVELRQGGGASAGSSGDVVGPTSSTDNAIVRFDGTTGKLVQNSVVTIADTTGALVGAASQSVFNTVSTTLNMGGAATAVNIGAATGTLTVANTTLAAKRITASTTLAVTGVSTLTAGAVIQGMTVGLGSGSVATNTAVGFGALLFNINGIFNSALGYEALRYNTTGSSNTATGNYALHSNSSGAGNTASGSTALEYNTLGDNNVATGASALQYNTSGSFNTAAGYEALRNTTGSRSTAFGWQALVSYTPPVVTAGAFVIATAYTIVTVGTTNFVAIGASANTVGVVFTATGAGSGTGTASTNVDATNTAIGYGAGSTITTGTKNTIIGAYSGNQGSLDIRTASNYIVLSDGDGNPRAYWNGANATFGGALTVTGATTLSSTLSLGGTVSGGGNQINNVVIGTSNPLAGAFTTVTTTGDLSTVNTITATNSAASYGNSNNFALFRNSSSAVVGGITHPAVTTLGLWGNTGVKILNGSTAATTIADFTSTALALGVGISLTGGTSGTGYSFSGSAPATSLTLDSSGNLGLGVTPDSWSGITAFQVGTGASLHGFGVNEATLSGNVYYNAGYKYAATSLASQYQQQAGEHRFFTAPSGTAGNAITFTQAMTLDASGNLGVGTTSPACTIDSAGIIRSKGATISASGEGTEIIYTSGTPWIASTNQGLVQAYNRGASTYSPLALSGSLLAFITGGTERARISAAGDLTISNGNLIVGTAGKGIDFSITSSGSGTMTSELLADYEEGTWTPVIIGNGGQSGQVYASQTGTYTKIGSQVTLRFKVALTTEGTFVGAYLLISGFPFSSAASPAAVSAGQFYFVDMATNYITIGAQILESSASAYLWAVTAAATSRTYVGTTDLTNTTQFTGTIIYFV